MKKCIANLLPKVCCLFIIFFLSGCADDVSFSKAFEMDKVGFWYGLWHGAIAPFSLIYSLFDSGTTIYAIYNNGFWYNFGFLIGTGSIFGGGASTRSRN